jgi:hypothetical protein
MLDESPDSAGSWSGMNFGLICGPLLRCSREASHRVEARRAEWAKELLRRGFDDVAEQP